MILLPTTLRLTTRFCCYPFEFRCHGWLGVSFYTTASVDAADRQSTKGPLGSIMSKNGLVQVGALSFWAEGEPPPWAHDWGADEIGARVSFHVEGPDGEAVVQKMRWIPAGRFMMGSPADEAERGKNEGPQHEVEITEGYWLFDTACSQALWQAVMGGNPSRFKGRSRPVEQVSFDEVQDFVERLNATVPGLDLALPSEAEWEYACRAGTTTPFSFGETITPEEVNYDGAHPYGSGKKGLDRQETVDVGTLPANGWGLHEMHGNVWEWCADWYGPYKQESVADPAGPATGAGRVLRGGSWIDLARLVRAALRNANVPGYRDDSVGFRCARVQAGATPAGQGRGQGAERRPDPAQPGGAELLRLDQGSPSASCAMPKASAFVVRTDMEELTFRRFERPSWASEIGRDGYGLWASFELPRASGEAVTQRMRWINPGRFMMGSPQGEAGWRDNEGPQHEVTISQGFWLFDTPCTQALWQAVMEENPSHFQSADRPVEQVSHDQVRAFLERIDERLPGLGLVLPSEAQWEYACRAGTSSASYAGDLEILGANNAPVLDAIAWYGGNSGVGFDLENGYDSSGWEGKQYPDSPSGTHPVGKKAAMDDNPSRFKSPTRPVEQVSFDEVQRFLQRTEELFPGLGLVLPSEAKWEYACRAWTEAATYAGDLDIKGANNAPVLDAIAWYGGNSGVGFELEDGVDLSVISERQYPDTPGGTHPVGEKQPNPWGLQDMLGNVWEWCADHWHENYEGAPTDGSVWLDPASGAERVLRGGSWLDVARLVRAAGRSARAPGNRSGNVGFRCARVQGS
ncbi:MAG: formylglycine-generating enzyme family protein [Hyphomicrobiales bacterium]|nr:formylglycine-generating enzyme family protein [Hyphomicrobiales bacterium]